MKQKHNHETFNIYLMNILCLSISEAHEYLKEQNNIVFVKDM